MKITSLISNTCAASIVALSFVACSDYDNGFTEKEIAFQEAFKQRFGVIDPEQDWNLATRGTLKVNFKEETNVKIYSKNPLAPGAVLMANYNVSAPSVLGFDMPEGTKDVFVQATSDRGMIVNGYVDMIANEGEVPMDDVENEVPETITDLTSATLKLKVYQKDVPDKDDEYKKIPLTYEYNLYSLNDVKVTTPNPWRVGDYRKILSTYKNSNGEEKDGVFKEGRDNWQEWMVNGVNGKKLDDNAIITTADKTPISLTFNYRNTSEQDNKFAYFYYKGNEIPSYNNIKLYNLIDNPTDGSPESLNYITAVNGGGTFNGGLGNYKDDDKIQGTTFHLVYYGEEGSSSTEGPLTSVPTASYEFPEGIHIGFAVIQNRQKPGTGVYDTDYIWFSIADLNPTTADWFRNSSFVSAFGGGNFSAAATFFINGTTFLGFEDCPMIKEDGTGSEIPTSDYNDLLFFVSGSIDDVGNVDEDPEIPLQGWIISTEDLGTTDDIDYNDVVIEVQHASGVDGEYVYVTPLAAGGTLASYLYFKDRLVGASSGLSGEIHALLDDNYKQELTSGDYEPLNVKANIIPHKGKPIPVNVGANFSLSPSEVGADNPDANMGGFNIRVVPQGKKRSEVTLEKLQRIQNSEATGNAPFVICTPNSWSRTEQKDGEDWIISGHYRWPWEQCNITKAYSENEHSFEKWVANKSDAIDWYAYPTPSLTCAPGVISERFDDGTVEPEPGPGTGNTFPSDAGDDITEYITDEEHNNNKFQVIPFSLISDYESCVITLQINGTVVVKDDIYGNDYTNDFFAETGIEGIYTITLEDLNAISKFTNGIWFSGATIEKAAIKGKKDSRIPMKIGDNFIHTDKIKETEQIDGYFSYDVDLSDYKLDNDFDGTVSIVIKFAENVTHVAIYTDHSWESSNYVNDERDYNGGKTEYELNVEISQLKDIINYTDSFNVRFSGGGSTNTIQSLSIHLDE